MRDIIHKCVVSLCKQRTRSLDIGPGSISMSEIVDHRSFLSVGEPWFQAWKHDTFCNTYHVCVFFLQTEAVRRGQAELWSTVEVSIDNDRCCLSWLANWNGNLRKKGRHIIEDYDAPSVPRCLLIQMWIMQESRRTWIDRWILWSVSLLSYIQNYFLWRELNRVYYVSLHCDLCHYSFGYVTTVLFVSSLCHYIMVCVITLWFVSLNYHMCIRLIIKFTDIW